MCVCASVWESIIHHQLKIRALLLNSVIHRHIVSVSVIYFTGPFALSVYVLIAVRTFTSVTQERTGKGALSF